MIDLLVLDVHGVVFNKPLRSFLRELAEQTGQAAEDVLELWDRELRTPAWTGQIGEAELWSGLTGSLDPASARHWRDVFESRFELGPIAPSLRRWSERVPIWLLSNHRSPWLTARLERFGLANVFDRVLVSDALGAAKPSARAFDPILESSFDPGRVLFVDDQMRNVRAARELGLQALLLSREPSSILAVEQVVMNAGVRKLDGSRPAQESRT